MSRLAIKGGEAVCKLENWPRWPMFDKAEEEQLLETLRSHNWGGYPSPNTKAREFATAFAAYQDAAYGVCCANGSLTLDAALRAAGVKAGDEVIVPCYTWLATAGCAVFTNAVPVFVDINPDDYTIDVNQVEAAITGRTRFVIPVHLGSSIADLDRLKEICAKHKLVLIEDCAHAHGAKWRGKGVGSHGDFGSFSFQSSKLMTSGEGGMILTSDKEYEEKLQSVVNCGRKEWGYDSFEGQIFGNNYRISDLQAAVLMGQMSRVAKVTLERQEAATYLTEELQKIEGITTLKRDERATTRAHYQYIFKYNPAGFKGLHRDRFIEALLAEGINTDGDFYEPIQARDIFSPPLDQFPMLKDRYPNGITAEVAHTPVAQHAAYQEAVWMHYHYLMQGRKGVDTIIAAIRKIQENVDELL